MSGARHGVELLAEGGLSSTHAQTSQRYSRDRVSGRLCLKHAKLSRRLRFRTRRDWRTDNNGGTDNNGSTDNNDNNNADDRSGTGRRLP